MSVDLVRLIYASRSSGHAPNLARGILAAAQKNNPGLDVTGLLIVGSDHFIQAMEGPRASVNQLFQRIVGDPRHRDVTLLSYCSTHLRYWGEWVMAYATLQELVDHAGGVKSVGTRLDPIMLDSEWAEASLPLVTPKRFAGLA